MAGSAFFQLGIRAWLSAALLALRAGISESLYNVTEFQEPGPPGRPANTSYIGLYIPVRLTMQGAEGDELASQTAAVWGFPAMVKTALLAWQQGVILDMPEKKVDWNYEVLLVDECQSKGNCSAARSVNLMNRLMLGDRLAGQGFPGVTATVGGYFDANYVAQASTALQVPSIGCCDGSPLLSDKATYGYFVRTYPSSAGLGKAMMSIMQALNFTKVDMWVCNIAERRSVRDDLMNQAPNYGLVVSTLLVPTSDYTGCPIEFSSAELANTWRQLVASSRTFGAHAHIPVMSVKCPMFDLLHYLALEGLVSKGHFWLGEDSLLSTSYKNVYLGNVGFRMCPFDAPPDQQVQSRYAEPRALMAFDGFTFLSTRTLGTKYTAWHNWFKSMQSRRDSIFESWYASKMPDVLWSKSEASEWRSPTNAYLFEAVWSVLRGINSLLVDVGPNFSGTQLLQRIASDSYEGLTGRVEMDESGDRKSLMIVRQFRVNVTARRLDTEHGTQLPGSSHQELELTTAVLRAFSGGAAGSAAQPRRTQAICTAPAGITNKGLLSDYFGCLVNTCADSANSLLQAVSGGMVPNCAVGKTMTGGNCEMDLSAMAPALPAGTKFKHICAGQCACQDCVAPTNLTDSSLSVAYFSCLKKGCTDAAPAFLQAVSGGMVPNCAAGKNMLGGNCEMDLSTMTKALPSGTKFKDLCAAQCPCSNSGNNTGPTPAPAAPTWTPPPVMELAVAEFFGKLEVKKPMLFYGGSSKLPPDEPLRCAPGSFYDSWTAECMLCKEGTYTSEVGESECRSCPGGTFGERTGQSLCSACIGGRYSGPQATRCLLCAPGNFTGDVQQTQCSRCLPGSYSNLEEAKECTLCAAGTYQPNPGQDRCLPCQDNLVTKLVGSKVASDCDCGVGFYRAADQTCRACEQDFPRDAVTCAGFGSPPILQAGYMTTPDSTTIYLCPLFGLGCPGGVPVGVEACAADSSSVACARCAETARFDAKNGICVPCENWPVAIFWAIAFLLFIALGLKLRPMEVEYGGVTLSRTVKVMFSTVPVVQLMDFCQFQSILGRTLVPWPTAEKDWYKILSGILDFKTFSVECFIGGDRDIYPLRHVVVMNLLPAIVLFACTILILPRTIFPSLRAKRFPAAIPAASTALSLMLIFFMTVLNLALNLVFSTYPHPQHTVSSLRAFPHILTTNSIMKTMEAVAIASILLWCVGTMTTVLGLLWFLPRRRNNLFLRRCTISIVARFSEDMAWWVVVELTLKILTTITLSVFERADSQLTWLTSIHVCYLFLTTWMQPYRYKRHSISDSVLTLGKLLVLVLAMPLLSDGESRAMGVSVATWLFYGLIACMSIWCLCDFAFGRQCDVEYEEQIFQKLWLRAARFLPVQDSIEEMAQHHGLRLTNSQRTSSLSGSDPGRLSRMSTGSPRRTSDMVGEDRLKADLPEVGASQLPASSLQGAVHVTV